MLACRLYYPISTRFFWLTCLCCPVLPDFYPFWLVTRISTESLLLECFQVWIHMTQHAFHGFHAGPNPRGSALHVFTPNPLNYFWTFELTRLPNRGWNLLTFLLTFELTETSNRVCVFSCERTCLTTFQGIHVIHVNPSLARRSMHPGNSWHAGHLWYAGIRANPCLARLAHVTRMQ